MVKKIILLGIAIVMIMSITACGVNELGDDSKENENSIEEIENGEETSEDENQSEYELTEEGIIKPEFAEGVIGETADQVIKALSTKDFELISEFTHPEKGVRFTPYTHVVLDSDIVLSQEEINNFFDNKEVYLWGHYDGIGSDISLTPSQYYDEFIYTEDFINAEEIGYNKVLSTGNMIENQFEVYETPIVVEYYFSGFNSEYEGMDWKSLRLVFEEYENNWRLVGIIHNQWTV